MTILYRPKRVKKNCAILKQKQHENKSIQLIRAEHNLFCLVVAPIIYCPEPIMWHLWQMFPSRQNITDKVLSCQILRRYDNVMAWTCFPYYCPVVRGIHRSPEHLPQITVNMKLQIFLRCSWWHHQMETCTASLAICAGNSPVTGEFPAQWPVTRIFDVFFDQCLSKQLSKQSWGWWFETPSRPLWRHCNVTQEAVPETVDLGRHDTLMTSLYWIMWTGGP